MSPDYCDAAQRHWEDADRLLTDARLANADHLFGLSAECSLKAVMLPLGMKLRTSGKPEDDRHGHIDRLWDEFDAFVTNRRGARYAAILAPHANPFFSNWKVDQRYDARSTFIQSTVNEHRLGAKLAKTCLDTALLDGIVI